MEIKYPDNAESVLSILPLIISNAEAEIKKGEMGKGDWGCSLKDKWDTNGIGCINISCPECIFQPFNLKLFIDEVKDGEDTISR